MFLYTYRYQVEHVYFFLQKFLEFVESAEYGVIYFSFGTIVDPSMLPNSTIDIFINVLKKLKQKVMWKWDSKNLPQLPNHVMVSDWFPQPDILGIYLISIANRLKSKIIIKYRQAPYIIFLALVQN